MIEASKSKRTEIFSAKVLLQVSPVCFTRTCLLTVTTGNHKESDK